MPENGTTRASKQHPRTLTLFILSTSNADLGSDSSITVAVSQYARARPATSAV